MWRSTSLFPVPKEHTEEIKNDVYMLCPNMMLYSGDWIAL